MANKTKPADALGRFMYGIFDFYTDKGMPVKTAKARMYDETLQTCLDMMKSEPDIPDHALVISLQFVSRYLNHRGVLLSKDLEKASKLQKQEDITALRVALGQLKALKTQVDEFISTYKGGTAIG